MLFSKLYAKHLPVAVEDILRTARRKVEEKYGEMLVNHGVKDEDPTEVLGNEEREETVAFRMPSNQLVYLGVRYGVFLEKMTNFLGYDFDCYVGRCMPEKREFWELLAEEKEMWDAKEEGEERDGEGVEGGGGQDIFDE